VSGDPGHMLQSQLRESIQAQSELLNSEVTRHAFSAACKALVDAYGLGKKVLIAGNGGSAADSQHIAAELVSRFSFDRPALSAIALTTDSSIITSVGNDYSFEEIFSRQIQAIGASGDVFVAISTSGNSPNILKALTVARSRKMTTIGLTGRSGGRMKDLCDICLCAPSDSTPKIQECHLVLEHALCAYVEHELFADQYKL
jgi:D-sedoheptulose 7-phosphate isomerase